MFIIARLAQIWLHGRSPSLAGLDDKQGLAELDKLAVFWANVNSAAWPSQRLVLHLGAVDRASDGRVGEREQALVPNAVKSTTPQQVDPRLFGDPVIMTSTVVACYPDRYLHRNLTAT
jgi:hypothetical protein